jgi:hypothetical protein
VDTIFYLVSATTTLIPPRIEGKDRSQLLESVTSTDLYPQVHSPRSARAWNDPTRNGKAGDDRLRPVQIILAFVPIWQRVRRLPAVASLALKLDQLACYHRHRVRLSGITFPLSLKNEPDRKLARRSRTKAKHLHNLFTVRNTVPWFFEATPKELHAWNEWTYSPKITGSGLRLKAHREFPTDSYHDGFEFHAMAFLSRGDGREL